MHDVVKALAVLQQVVDTTHDTEDTKGKDPDTDNGDDGGVASNEPTEETEHGCNDIDDQNGARQLPGWDTAPEGTVGTRDEDEPIFGERDFEEQDFILDTEVLDDTSANTLARDWGALWAAVREHGGEGDPGTDGENYAEKNGHTPKLGQVPLDGGLGEWRVVVGNGEGGDVGENGDEDDQFQVEGLVENGDPETEEEFQMQGQGDTVDNVGVHAMENLAGSLERVDDGRETGSQEDNVSSRAGGVRSTFDGNTSIGLFQGWSVVDTVTCHGNEVTTLLENLDDVVLVLGEDFGKTIGSLDEIVDFGAGHFTATTETETFSVVHVGTETELAGGFTGNTDGITSQHLDGETETLGFVDSAVGIVTWRIGARHDAENFPRGITTLASNTEGAETTGGEFGDLVLVCLIDIIWNGVVFLDGLQDEKWCTLDADDALTLGRLDDGLDLLGDGVEGEEFNDLVLGEDRLGTGVIAEGLQESLVDGIDTLLLAGGGQAGSQHEVFRLDTSDTEGLGKGELVLGQRAGLVGAQNFDTSEGLDSRQLLDNGLLLGEVGGTDSHGGCDDGWKTDGHTDNGNGEGELEDGDDGVGSVKGRNPDDEKGDNDEDQEDGTNAVEHFGEMASAAGGRGDERGGTADEGAVTGCGDDHEGLATLDGGGRVAGVAIVLVDSKRLAGDGGLIDLEVGVFGDDAAVGGDNGTFFDLENVTGDDFGGFDFLELAVTEDGGLESERLLQFLDNGAGLVLLDEADGGVEQEQGANDTEIDPILKTGSKDGGGLK